MDTYNLTTALDLARPSRNFHVRMETMFTEATDIGHHIGACQAPGRLLEGGVSQPPHRLCLLGLFAKVSGGWAKSIAAADMCFQRFAKGSGGVG